MEQAARPNDWQRVAYLRLSDGFVAAAKLLSRITEPVALGAEPPCWSVLPTAADATAPIQLAVEFHFGGEPLRAHLNAGALQLALGGLVSRETFAKLDRRLQLALLATTLRQPLEAIGNRLGVTVQLSQVLDPPPDPQPGAPANCWAFEVYDPQQQAACKLLVEFLGQLPNPAQAALASAAARRRSLDQVPVSASLELGRTALPLAECRGLEPGDVIMLDECYLADNRLRVNVGDALSWQGCVARPDPAVAASIAQQQTAAEASP